MKTKFNTKNNCIYLVTNKITGKQYVGVSSHDSYKARWNRHVYTSTKNSQTHLHRSIRKYGKDAFTIKPIYWCDDRKFLFNIAEPFFINMLNTFKHGYNMTSGGEGMNDHIVSEETRRKLSIAQTGKTAWNKGQKFDNGQKGRLHSEETKAKLREIALNRPEMSDSTKAKIGNIHRGMKRTDETRENISKALKGQVGHRAKSYKLQHPTGRIEIVHNMKIYAETMGWSYDSIRQGIRRGIYRGIKITKNDKDHGAFDQDKIKTQSSSTKEKISKASEIYTYQITTPDGHKITTTNLREFCKEHNLDQGNLSRVMKGKAHHHKGFTGTIIHTP